MAKITESEIVRVAALMKIDAGDAASHVPKIKKMIKYFESLDLADMGDSAPNAHVIPLDALRGDERVECPDGLMGHLNGEAGEHIRSPDLK